MILQPTVLAWLEAGLQVLANRGHKELKLKYLCEEASLSSGSFYYHFKDKQAYQRELLCYWADEYVPAFARNAFESAESPEKELDLLRKLIAESGGPVIDSAVRRWAEENPDARQALVRADAFRRRKVQEIARRAGLEATDDQMALHGMAWAGSASMKDQRERLRLISTVLDGNLRQAE